MEAVLTEYEANAVIQSDYFSRLRQSLDTHDSIDIRTLDEDTVEVLSQEEHANALAEFVADGNREGFDEYIRTRLGGAEPPLLTERQVRDVTESDSG
ncbi:TPA: hypothetical protein EYP38_01645 [Candidatus Micrarchaeota archaeon]|nr:hypothetical protein [Candidatus Micrarchaeota archaeon]